MRKTYTDHLQCMQAFLQQQEEVIDPMVGRLTEQIYQQFYDDWDVLVQDLEHLMAPLRADSSLYRAHYPALQAALHRYILAAPSMARVYRRPLGFPGDYAVMEALWETWDRFRGDTALGALLERHSLNIPLARANRQRMAFLADYLLHLVGRNPAARILSLASGPAIEIRMLLDRMPWRGDERIQITLVDSELAALDHSHDRISQFPQAVRDRCAVHVAPLDAITFLRRAAEGSYDLIYAFGLCDYLRDTTCAALLRYAARLLAPDGAILLANYSMDGHQHRAYLDLAMEWEMIYRGEEDLAQLAQRANLDSDLLWAHPRPWGGSNPVKYLHASREPWTDAMGPCTGTGLAGEGDAHG